VFDELVVGSQNLEIHALNFGGRRAGTFRKDLFEDFGYGSLERIQSGFGIILDVRNFDDGGSLTFALGLFGVDVDGSIDGFFI
jgi:hypothetical protein